MKKSAINTVVILLAVMMVFGMVSQTSAGGRFDGGAGSAMIFTYYDVRSETDGGLGLTDNYFTVGNNSTHWVQSHVRVRTGDCSVEILDFDILQSPKDVFAFDLFEDQGAMVFASCDTNTLVDSGFTLNVDRDADGTDDCFVLDSTTFPAMLSLITICGDCATGRAIADTEAVELAKKGYVEVIEEGRVIPKTGNKNQCLTPVNPEIAIPGKTLFDLNRTACAGDLAEPEPVLQGRQYYVEVDTAASPAVVKRLAQLNALIADSFRDEDGNRIIFHANTYTDELGHSDCNDTDGFEECYAYAAPETADTAGASASGANDMNWCFYTNTIGTSAVINKFGAAATIGPTLADLWINRDGRLNRTHDVLEERLIPSLALTSTSNDFFADVIHLKQYVDSHYFSAPPPGPFDISTAFAFVFPFKHFISENETIQAIEIYDNEENRETILPGKFLSPGLPTPAEFSEEAELFKLLPPFNEGWIRFEVSATNATAGCIDRSFNDEDCEVSGRDQNFNRVDPPGRYIPGYTGAVFTTGSENIGVSPFNHSAGDIRFVN